MIVERTCFGLICCVSEKTHGLALCFVEVCGCLQTTNIWNDIKLLRSLETDKERRSRESRLAKPIWLTTGFSRKRCSLCRSEPTSRSRDTKTASVEMKSPSRKPKSRSRCLRPPCFGGLILFGLIGRISSSIIVTNRLSW